MGTKRCWTTIWSILPIVGTKARRLTATNPRDYSVHGLKVGWRDIGCGLTEVMKLPNPITMFRPSKISEMVGQVKVKGVVIQWVADTKAGKPTPNLIFTGEHGLGKTTMAFAVASELFGEDWKNYVLELNASDERGIDAIREKVREFARRHPISEDFKCNLIILDEADYLTPEAQAILRRVMEDYADITKFILCCNWLNRIILPIRDRCLVLKFERYNEQDIKEIIQQVAKVMNIADVDVERVVKASGGSMRKAIIELNRTAGDFKDIDTITSKNLGVILRAHDVDTVIEKVFEQVMAIPDDKARIKIGMKLADAEYHIRFGCNPYIQLKPIVEVMEKCVV